MPAGKPGAGALMQMGRGGVPNVGTGGRELSVLEWVSECTCILVPLHSSKSRLYKPRHLDS